MSGIISLESIADAIRQKFPARIAEGNIAAAKRAFTYATDEIKQITHVDAG